MFQDKVLKVLWTLDDPETICNRLEEESLSDSITEDGREIAQKMVELAAKLKQSWAQQANNHEQ